MRRRVSATVLSLSLLLLGACGAGVAPGNAQRGYVIWGYLGQGSTTAAGGQPVALVDASGQTVQTVTSDGTGKYVFAYHQPGSYRVQVGNLVMPVQVAAADQRLDIDLS